MEFVLPIDFEKKMKNLLGEEWENFSYSYTNNNYHGLRFNPIKVKEENEEEILIKLGIINEAAEKNNIQVPWEKKGFYYDNQARPGKHPYHEAGLYYIQEPSAMSAAAMLDPVPGMKVLDLCAAPGGKTTQLAGKLKNAGLLVANEINNGRCKILAQNIERLGIRNAVVTNEDSFKLADKFGSFFHAILVDAPCSGEGMFRKNPEAMNEWSLENVEICANRQSEILDNAARMLLPGGTLVYSTCTFAPEENEKSIESFLKRHEEFEIVEVEAPWFSPAHKEWSENGIEEVERTFRLWPHKLNGEGHYVAVLKKKGVLNIESKLSEEEIDFKKKKVKKIKKEVMTKEQQKYFEEFLECSVSETVKEWLSKGRYIRFGEMLYNIPKEMPNLDGIHVLRSGLCLGEFKKNRFEPSHALAVALDTTEVLSYVDISSDDERVIGYYKGETIFTNENDDLSHLEKKGWCLVCVDGYSAGWGKIAGAQIKNHYPKGLRRDLSM